MVKLFGRYLPEVLPEEVIEEEVGGRVDADEEVARVDDHLYLQNRNLSKLIFFLLEKRSSLVKCLFSRISLNFNLNGVSCMSQGPMERGG